MATHEEWLQADLIRTTWESPLSPTDLVRCFNLLAVMIVDKSVTVNILFDLRRAMAIPAQAPMIAMRSGVLTHPNTGKIVVVSKDVFAEVLANLAASLTRREIVFFPTYEAAMESLQSAETSPKYGARQSH